MEFHEAKTLQLYGDSINLLKLTYSMEFYAEYSLELPRNTTGLQGIFICFAHMELPWKRFSMAIPLGRKYAKTPWRLRGIPREIVYEITMKHDVFHPKSRPTCLY